MCLECLKASFSRCSKQPMMNQDTTDSPELIQPSEGCTTGKESKKMYFSTAGIATRVIYTRLLQ